MSSEFVHLHIHTDYSMLDGACKIRKLAKMAEQAKMKALAITDHGNLCGAVEFYSTMIEHGIKPIIGCECYLAPNSRLEKNQNHPYHKGYHQILYAENLEGYRNLCRLNALAYRDGFYFKPRIDKEILSEHRQGIVGTSSCIGGEIPAYILADNLPKARQSLDEYLNIFGRENFYLELQDHGMAKQKKVNLELINLSREFDIPLIATNDIHYLAKEHAAAHDILLCVGTQKNVDDEDRLRFPSEEFYFKSGAEMQQLFCDIPTAISNTLEVAERCNVKFELNKVNHYPVFKTPDQSDRKSYLIGQCKIGLKERFDIELGDQDLGDLDERQKTIVDRMYYEIGVIDKMGFSSYFLVVWDFLHFARTEGIPIGPGRGSGAGSLVAYLLRITDIDPLRYNLLFERFLNPDRVSPPDFDIDLCERRRVEVIRYVRDKYGDENVAQIGTFGTLKAKAVVKDVTRAMGRTFDEGIRLTKLIPAEPKMTIKKALAEVKELQKLRETEDWIDRVFTHSEILEGLSRNMSIHAAGVIIGDQPLTNLVPLARGQGNEVITQYPAMPCEAFGLLKLDFLGLRTLTIIQDTCDLIEFGRSIKVNPSDFPLENAETFDLINKGNTISVFQLESSGMRDLCRRFGVHRIEDIIALIALYRPGPMQFLDEFIARKMGKKKVEYDLPSMKSILEETYGIMLYQEQVMQVVQTVAGFSLAQADILRRARGKKKQEEMKAQFEKFAQGCRKNGISEDKAKKIFDKIEMFAGYGFNKSHSAAYAMIAYQTAYLKANYAGEFMCSNLSNEMHSAERVSFLITECREMGIDVLPPDVNRSHLTFTVDNGTIRFGLAAIKGVGAAAGQSILESRKDGEFCSISDFCERVAHSVNRRIMENLTQCGAFDCFDLKRSQLYEMIDDVIGRAQTAIRDRESGQENFFDILDTDDDQNGQNIAAPDIPEWDQKKLLKLEKELLGFYVTGHPLAEFEKVIKTYSLHTINALSRLPDQQGVRFGGIISSLKLMHSKKDGKPWAIINIEDFDDAIEGLVYSNKYMENSQHLVEENPIFVEGFISLKDTESKAKIVVSEIHAIEHVPVRNTEEIHIRIYEANISDTVLSKLAKLCQSFPGSTAVILTLFCTSGEIAFIKTNKKFYINFTTDFERAVENLLGEESLLIKPNKTAPERERKRWDATRSSQFQGGGN